MRNMVGIAAAIGIVGLALSWFFLLRFFRDRSMRFLAQKLGFQYTGRSFPTCFPATAEPFDKIRLKWNAICGRRDGIDIIVFDCIYGTGRGIYRTYIAVRSPQDPFPSGIGILEKVLQSSGWSALFGRQMALDFVPWSLSVERIQEIVDRLTL
jgi:hypothetical protein